MNTRAPQIYVITGHFGDESFYHRWRCTCGARGVRLSDKIEAEIDGGEHFYFEHGSPTEDIE